MAILNEKKLFWKATGWFPSDDKGERTKIILTFMAKNVHEAVEYIEALIPGLEVISIRVI